MQPKPLGVYALLLCITASNHLSLQNKNSQRPDKEERTLAFPTSLSHSPQASTGKRRCHAQGAATAEGLSNEKHNPEIPPSLEYQSICLSKLRASSGIPYTYSRGIPVNVCRTQAKCPASDVNTTSDKQNPCLLNLERQETQTSVPFRPRQTSPQPWMRHLGSSPFALLLATAPRISFQATARPRASGRKK